MSNRIIISRTEILFYDLIVIGILDYTAFCKQLTSDIPSIHHASVVDIRKALGVYSKPGAWFPDKKDAIHFIAQINMLVGIPESNKKFFPPLEYITVNHKEISIFLFPLSKRRVLTVIAKNPINHDDIARRLLEKSKLVE